MSKCLIPSMNTLKGGRRKFVLSFTPSFFYPLLPVSLAQSSILRYPNSGGPFKNSPVATSTEYEPPLARTASLSFDCTSEQDCGLGSTRIRGWATQIDERTSRKAVTAQVLSLFWIRGTFLLWGPERRICPRSPRVSDKTGNTEIVFFKTERLFAVNLTAVNLTTVNRGHILGIKREVQGT